jgi:hypothetical protein
VRMNRGMVPSGFSTRDWVCSSAAKITRVGRSAVNARPAFLGEPFLRQEPALVIHLG